jgi:protein-tyrosine phosphatase
MEAQAILLDGVENARELGGYRIGDKVIKKNTLLRTGKLDQASAAAVSELSQKYRLQYITDFRMSEEQTASPDVTIPGCEHLCTPVMETSDMNKPDPEFIAAYSDPNSTPIDRFNLIYERNYINDTLYPDFLLKKSGIRAYSVFFKTALSLDEGRAILWHCTDGKDRTGLAAMLMLSALGASKETIIDDYMLTNRFNEAKLSAAKKEAASHGFPPEKTDIFLFVSGGVIRHFMEHAIDTLNDRYGSVCAYITQELGLADDDIRSLKDRFLES